MSRANQWEGQYGKAIEAVHHAVATGLHIRQVAKKFKVSPDSVRIAAKKLGIVLPGVRPHNNYGKVKDAVFAGHEQGLTYAEVAAKYGQKIPSLYRAAAYLGLSLKPSKQIK